MRVLHLAERLTGRGGADWHLLGVLRALVQLGLETHLAAGELGSQEISLSAEPTLLPSLAARTRQPVDLDRLLTRIDPDLVHLHNVVNPALLEWVAERDLPAVATVQDHRALCPGRGKWTAAGAVCDAPLDRARCAACFDDARYFDAIWQRTRARLEPLTRLELTVLSHYMKRQLVAAGVPAPRVTVIPPFVHGLAGAAEAPARARHALFCGRLVRAKGPLEATTAWRASGLALPMVFAGTGPLRDELTKQGHRVTGWLDHHRLGPLYRDAAVLVMPCRWQEPFGIVGLEALWLGTPVAAWDSGGVAEWCPSEGLVPWGDVEALGAAMARLAGTRARPQDRFSRHPQMQRLLRVYRRAGAAPAVAP